jgi:hypothetical protein
MAPRLGPLLQPCKLATAGLSVKLDKRREQRHRQTNMCFYDGQAANRIVIARECQDPRAILKLKTVGIVGSEFLLSCQHDVPNPTHRFCTLALRW